MKLVSVIVLNHNGEATLGRCLDALARQTYTEVEFILVDNASTDGSVEEMAGFLISRRGELLRLPENRGFAGGNVAGLGRATGELVAVLNNDAYPADEWLAELVGAMDSDPSAGICASRIVQASDPLTVDSAGDGCVTSGHGVKRGNGERTEGWMEPGYVFGASAAAALYRRAMLDDAGFFDEDFFLNCEDTDLNFRAQLLGWKCRYVPSAVVLHEVSSTVVNLSDVAVYHSTRNDEWVWVKNMPWRLMLLFLPDKIIQETASFLYFVLARRRWRPFFAGKMDALKGLPAMIRKRRALSSRIRVGPSYVRSILTPVLSPGLVRAKIRRLAATRRA